MALTILQRKLSYDRLDKIVTLDFTLICKLAGRASAIEATYSFSTSRF
jgi:hypothetical protein